MENLVLQAWADEIRPSVIGRYCAQVTQVGPSTIALEFSGRPPTRLILDLSDFPFCFLSTNDWPHETPSSFVGLLRKWVTPREFRSLTKNLDERILHLEFVSKTLAEDSSTVILIAEMIPRWGNLYLLDPSGHVLGALSGIRAERRHLSVGQIYQPPAKPGRYSLNQFADEPPTISLPADASDLARTVRGLGPVFAEEVSARARMAKCPPSLALSGLLRELAGDHGPCRVYNLPSHRQLPVIAPVEMKSLSMHASEEFGFVNQAIERVFKSRFESTLFEQQRKEIRRYLEAALKKFQRINEKLTGEIDGFSEELKYQKLADLILAQAPGLHPRGNQLEVYDVYSDGRPSIVLTLDPRLSPIENAQRFYERAKRARRAMAKIEARQKEVQQTMNALQSSLEHLMKSRTLSEVEDVSRSVTTRANNSPMRRRETQKALPHRPAIKKKKCRIFRTSDHQEIFVGRNSKENDRVTTEYAQPEDYWFHAADYAGSHVVLRNPENSDLEDTRGFLEAAQVAAYFSQARNAKKVSVHWTRKKFVKKPRRAKPGLVTLSKFQTIMVEPKLPAQNDSLPES